MQIAPGTGIPRPSPRDFAPLKVVITPKMKRLYTRMGREDFVEKVIASGAATSRKRAARKPAIIMARNSLVSDYEFGGDLAMTADDCFVHSSWSGYLDGKNEQSGWVVAGKAGARRVLIHTSGHASAADLARFANAVSPRWLVPVHGVKWDSPGIDLPPVKRLSDGENWMIGRPGFDAVKEVDLTQECSTPNKAPHSPPNS
jgi:ribonuclease J